jgi:dihydroflavonol-4-reductase
MISTSGKPNPLLREVNVTGTGNMLAICKRFGVSRFIHVSSVHALPELPMGVVVRETSALNPDAVVGPYAKSKAEATLLVLQAAAAGLPASVVFPTGLCGPGDHGDTPPACCSRMPRAGSPWAYAAGSISWTRGMSRGD